MHPLHVALAAPVSCLANNQECAGLATLSSWLPCQPGGARGQCGVRTDFKHPFPGPSVPIILAAGWQRPARMRFVNDLR
jgi:hypothetical protein